MYLDANFFIFAKFDAGKKGAAARVVVQKISRGFKATTSALALDEVMWVLRKNGHAELTRECIEEIYSMENVEIKSVESQIPLQAISFMEKYHLKPRDAFHCAIMNSYGENEIASDDADFDKVGNIKRIKL